MTGKMQVGFKWEDAKGRVWQIWERLPFGRCRVRVVSVPEAYEGPRHLHGEMRLSDLRAELAGVS